MDLKLYAMIKNMISGITKGDRGEKGDSGYMTVVNVTEPTVCYTLFNNTEYRIDYSDSLTLELDFTKDHDGNICESAKSGMICAFFTIPEDSTSIAFPNDIKWAVSTPVFTKGNTYMLAFVPYGNSAIGIWTVIE